MSKFKKGDKKTMPAGSTSSLSDIVFMLLFFFMVASNMKEVTLIVKVKLPEATEVTKARKEGPLLLHQHRFTCETPSGPVRY